MSLPNVSANPFWIYRDEGNRLFLALFKGLGFLSGFLKGNIYIYLHMLYLRCSLSLAAERPHPWVSLSAVTAPIVGKVKVYPVATVMITKLKISRRAWLLDCSAQLLRPGQGFAGNKN